MKVLMITGDGFANILKRLRSRFKESVEIFDVPTLREVSKFYVTGETFDKCVVMYPSKVIRGYDPGILADELNTFLAEVDRHLGSTSPEFIFTVETEDEGTLIAENTSMRGDVYAVKLFSAISFTDLISLVQTPATSLYNRYQVFDLAYIKRVEQEEMLRKEREEEQARAASNKALFGENAGSVQEGGFIDDDEDEPKDDGGTLIGAVSGLEDEHHYEQKAIDLTVGDVQRAMWSEAEEIKDDDDPFDNSDTNGFDDFDNGEGRNNDEEEEPFGPVSTFGGFSDDDNEPEEANGNVSNNSGNNPMGGMFANKGFVDPKQFAVKSAYGDEGDDNEEEDTDSGNGINSGGFEDDIDEEDSRPSSDEDEDEDDEEERPARGRKTSLKRKAPTSKLKRKTPKQDDEDEDEEEEAPSVKSRGLFGGKKKPDKKKPEKKPLKKEPPKTNMGKKTLSLKKKAAAPEPELEEEYEPETDEVENDEDMFSQLNDASGGFENDEYEPETQSGGFDDEDEEPETLGGGFDDEDEEPETQSGGFDDEDEEPSGHMQGALDDLFDAPEEDGEDEEDNGSGHNTEVLFQQNTRALARGKGRGLEASKRVRTDVSVKGKKVKKQAPAKELQEKLSYYRNRGAMLVFTGSHGTGKTVIAGNIANLLTKMGQSVCVLDLDTIGKGQSYLNAEVSEMIHGSSADKCNNVGALNSSGTDFARYLDIVRPGLHMISSGLASDSKQPSELINNRNFSRVIRELTTNYNFVIVDVQFQDLKDQFQDFIDSADSLIFVEEATTHGMMNFMINLTNVENETAQSVIFHRGLVILNKEDGMNTFLGRKVDNTKKLLQAIDEVVTTLVGDEPEFKFEDLQVAGIIPYNKNFEAFWHNKKYISDTDKGAKMFEELLKSCL